MFLGLLRDGRLALAVFVEHRQAALRAPADILASVARYAPDPSWLPAARAECVLEEARRLAANGHQRALAALEIYGLDVVESMVRSGELERFGIATLRTWGGDAAAKQNSFAATRRALPARAILDAMQPEERQKWR